VALYWRRRTTVTCQILTEMCNHWLSAATHNCMELMLPYSLVDGRIRRGNDYVEG